MGLKNLADKIKKEQREANKSFEEKFIDEIDKFLVEEAKRKRSESSRLAFRPSQYYKCERQTFYFLKGVKGVDGIYPRSQRILQVGTRLHEWIQNDILMKMNELGYPIKILPKEELPFYGAEGVEIIEDHTAPPTEIKFIDFRFTEKFPISAMIDGALEYNGYPFIFEFKTINPNEFEYLIEPLPDHIKQGALYSLCIGLKKVLFLYLCKGTQNFKAYMVDYRDDQLEWVVNKIKGIEEQVLLDVLPDKEEDSLTCRFCPYSSICKKEELCEI
ncbi:MAG: hypothetical protein GX892_10930 [Thermoanaerobacteraceae bacterium]|nr:hypothetical protein [Thermoanaerobacteraceae bacterium]